MGADEVEKEAPEGGRDVGAAERLEVLASDGVVALGDGSCDDLGDAVIDSATGGDEGLD
ncbi:hypothetical protein [Actinacidiphila oryziradicis]|uniref:hypothetical protein n=1 Tax=Actinacidiphila oryziradicis TaxID=2571141 RepID=UPI00145EA72B|nr:hypothetical protein [Actinacidiphila oryziradicis]